MVLPYKGLIRQNSILSGREHVQGDNDKDDPANSNISLLQLRVCVNPVLIFIAP